MSVWRCRLCEGVNRGGRVCVTCGAEVPRGEPLRAAVRTIAPSTFQPVTPPLPSTASSPPWPAPPWSAPPPVPPSRSRRDLATMPAPEEIYPVDSDDPLDFDNAFDIRPLPGGCLVTLAPRRPRSF